MEKDKTAIIYEQFDVNGRILGVEELASGHINDTYLIRTDGTFDVVLQRINHMVFKDVPGLVKNKVLISDHVRSKLEHLPAQEKERRCLRFIPAKGGDYYFQDTEGGYWNMMVFIDKSRTHETVHKEEVAFEGGKLFGEFLNLTADFDAVKLIDVIPKFHDMSFRFEQFEEARSTASDERLAIAAPYLDKIEELREEMHILQGLKESGEIPLRVTHNDTKISNALFDENDKALCVIDTDTVMPGIIHYDFGDAIRTICNSAAEDEKDLSKVSFNADFYLAYYRGFIEQTRDSISELEKRYLPLGAKTMIFIMGIRFLTDYLNNDIYYKTKYKEHNLDRAKNQFKLIESMEAQLPEILEKTKNNDA